MLKKYKDFIKENVDTVDVITPTTTKYKPRNDGKRYVMMFVVKDDKIEGDIALFDDVYLENGEYREISVMLLYAQLIDGKMYKVEIQEEFVNAARKQTGLELEIAKGYSLPEDQPLYSWLLEHIDKIH